MPRKHWVRGLFIILLGIPGGTIVAQLSSGTHGPQLPPPKPIHIQSKPVTKSANNPAKDVNAVGPSQATNGEPAVKADTPKIQTTAANDKAELNSTAIKNPAELATRELAFASIAGFTAFTVLVLVGYILVGLGRKGSGWSIASAISEESQFQPSQIDKNSVIVFASASRFIAVIGLCGIFSIVLGIGYYLLWSLFLFNEVPANLGKISTFLASTATLFVPYAFNQVRAAVTDRKTVPQGTDKPAAEPQAAGGMAAVAAAAPAAAPAPPAPAAPAVAPAPTAAPVAVAAVAPSGTIAPVAAPAIDSAAVPEVPTDSTKKP